MNWLRNILIGKEINSIYNKLDDIESRLSKLESMYSKNKTNLQSISEAIKGVYGLVDGIINIGQRRN